MTDDERQELQDELLMAQLDKTRLDIDRVRQEMRWEPWKVGAAFIAGVAVFGGLVLGVANLLRPAPAPITFPPGTTITVPRN